MKKTNNIKALTQSIRAEEREKARAEIYKELLENQAKLEMLGLSQPLPTSIMSDMKAGLSKAVKGAVAAQKQSIRLGVKAEIEELAGLEGCHLPSLLSEALADNIEIDDTGNVMIVDAASKLPLRDRKTGKAISPYTLILQAKENPDYRPLFEDSGNASKAVTKTFMALPSRNPWKKGELNLTQQAKILSENPAMAERLREAAKG
jgi:hypothetical protein